MRPETVIYLPDDTFWLALTDEDVLNQDELLRPDLQDPRTPLRGWVFYSQQTVCCVVFSTELHLALDLAADAGKLESYRVTEDEAEKYGGDILNSDELEYLGNSCAPYDIQSLRVLEFAVPALSACRLLGPSLAARADFAL